MASETRWLSTDEQKMWRAFIAMTQLLYARLGSELQAEHGLQLSAYEILVRLSEAPDWTLRMSELAENALSSRSRMSHAISRLEDLGWVERTSCETDKRGSFAKLTDIGFSVLEDAAPTHVEGVRSYLFDPLTDEEVIQLQTISEKILDRLDQDRSPSDCQ